jgi:lysophospholipase L1-like esterase
LTLILVLFTSLLNAQEYPLAIDHYSFINYEKNSFDYQGQAQKQYDAFFEKHNNLVLKGDQTIHILHIGDSHIQADYFSGQMRKRIQTLDKDGVSARGFLFPFKAAKTNNPPDYKVETTSNWERCRNVTKGYACELGISGINIHTNDSLANLSIFPSGKGDYLHYTFNRIRIYHNLGSVYYDISLANYDGNISRTYNYQEGYTELTSTDFLDRADFVFTRYDSVQTTFILHGISFESTDPGIIYSAVGVNGAETRSFNKCQLLEDQLSSLAPDWMIVSLGTNDAYMRGFKPDFFYANYDTLLSRIRKSIPDAALLLTVPGDSYRGRRYPNYNTVKAREIIYQLATKYNAAVWDFYTVMGGQNSINYWYRAGLANRDKLHLNKNGYILQGNLLFNAYIKSFDQYNLNRFAN